MQPRSAGTAGRRSATSRVKRARWSLDASSPRSAPPTVWGRRRSTASRRAWLRLCMSASSGTATPDSRRVGWPCRAGGRSRPRRARSSARIAPHCSDVRSQRTWPAPRAHKRRVGLTFPPSFHLGVQLATTRASWQEIQDAARRVEALGYDSVWVPDHLVSREAAADRLEAWQLLAAIAASTRRIRVGPLVSPVNFRHPAVLAKMAATVDHVSDGRLILGLGAGGLPIEHEMFGIAFGPRSERIERLDEACVVVRSMFDDPQPVFIGRHYQLWDATAEPKPIQAHLPILIGGGTPSVVGVAARHADMWNTIATPDAFPAAVAS